LSTLKIGKLLRYKKFGACSMCWRAPPFSTQ